MRGEDGIKPSNRSICLPRCYIVDTVVSRRKALRTSQSIGGQCFRCDDDVAVSRVPCCLVLRILKLIKVDPGFMLFCFMQLHVLTSCPNKRDSVKFIGIYN